MPWSNQPVVTPLLIVKGPTGEFVYDASGNLRSANVGQVAKDPLQGITCQQGLSTFNGHGFVITLLSTAATSPGFFQYLDNGAASQGALIFSTNSSSSGGTDPVTSTGYPAGQQGTDPVFGDFVQILGATIAFGIASVFNRNSRVTTVSGSGAAPPYIETDSPEQTTLSHAALRLQGASPDGTKPAQALLAAVAGAGTITRATNELLEVQGNIAATLVKAVVSGVEETWHQVGAAGQPAFSANWSNFGGGFASLSFRKVPSPANTVQIVGTVTAGAGAGATIFTLPAGYPPASNQQFCITQLNPATNWLDVLTSGAVNLHVATTGTFTIEVLLSLDI